MEDGLYFRVNSAWQWVAEADPYLVVQANDLLKPESLQASYSGNFPLPDTEAIRSLLSSAEQLDSGGALPYDIIPARLVQEGEVVFSGNAELTRFAGGWQTELSAAMVSMVDRLTAKKLRDLNLGHLDHEWNVSEINARAGAASGVLYPAIDYGTLTDTQIPYDTLTPAVYGHTLISQMLSEVGYRPAGSWLSDPLIRRLIVPFCEAEPLAQDEEWVRARSARVGVSGDVSYLISPGAIGGTRSLNVRLPLTLDNLPDEGFFDGNLNAFNPQRAAYVAPESMRLKISASIMHRTSVQFGAVEILLQAERNGSVVTQAYFSARAGYNPTSVRLDTLELDETIDVRQGDEVTLRLIVRKKTDICRADVRIRLHKSTAFAGFEPDPTVHFGDRWPVARNLPDLSCWDFLKSVALMTSSFLHYDDSRRTVELVGITEVVKAPPQEMTHLVEEGTEPEWTPRLEGYAQKNWFRWKETEGVPKGFGDGFLTINDATIEAETTLFELPFAASTESGIHLPGYGKPAYVQTRTASEKGVQKKATTPRLLLAEPDSTVTIRSKVLEGVTLIERPVTLTGCWFDKRPAGAVRQDNYFCLRFGGLTLPGGESPLLETRFTGLKRVLRRPRVLTLSLVMHPSDMATLSLRSPVEVGPVRLGSLDLPKGFYILNKINNYRPGEPCTVTLIAF